MRKEYHVASDYRTMTSEDDIRWFAKKSGEPIQLELIRNPATPTDVLERLAKVKSDVVSGEARRRLTNPDTYLATVAAEEDADRQNASEAEKARRAAESERDRQEAIQRRERWTREHAEGVDAVWGNITTLPFIPGHRIDKMLGVVTVLTSASGLTAAMKGNEALDEAERQLLDAARLRGANAVVGLTCSTFGAKGGITSALGGDAVGVMLMGTAVVIVPEQGD